MSTTTESKQLAIAVLCEVVGVYNSKATPTLTQLDREEIERVGEKVTRLLASFTANHNKDLNDDVQEAFARALRASSIDDRKAEMSYACYYIMKIIFAEIKPLARPRLTR